jgi:hypothetical protein
MVHVLAFFGLGEAEGEAAEVRWSGRHMRSNYCRAREESIRV